MRRGGLDPLRAAGSQRGHHLGGRAEPGGTHQPLGLAGDLVADRVVAGQEFGGRNAGGNQRRGRTQQRIPGVVGLDVSRPPVADLGVAAGVPAEADRPQVQEDGSTGRADPLDRLDDQRPRGRRIGAVDRDVGQARARSVRRLDPARRRRDRDAPAVVLADQQQRHRETAVGGIERGVDRPDGGGVVDRGIAEGADDHGVGRPLSGDAQALGPMERDGQPHRPGQMRRDGRRLRDDRQIGMAEDLVPAAGDRLGGQRHQSLQHVPDRRRSLRPDAPAPRRTPRTGSAAAPDRSAAGPERSAHCPRAPPSRSCRSPHPGAAARGR